MNTHDAIEITTCDYAAQDAKVFAFVLRNILYVRNFEWPIRELAKAGHRVVVLIGDREETSRDAEQQINLLQHDLGDRLSIQSINTDEEYQRRLMLDIQSSRDILFYSGDHYKQAQFARERIVAKSTPFARFLFSRAFFRSEKAASRAKRWLKALYEAVPAEASIIRRLQAISPDVLVISPLIDIRTRQLYWVKAAKHLGIRSVLAVASWDNLTNKSLIQDMPDKIFVWNNIQKEEAVRLHGAVPETITVTGAQLYDHWFDRSPSLSYDEFCAQFSFEPAAILLLYTGSSASIAKNEASFVTEWLQSLRACPDARIRNANILIRPHPLNQAGLAAADFSRFGKVAVYPKNGGFPVTKIAQNEYYDALYHCEAIVGINTSAIVEAAILNRQSFTITTPEFQNTQQGTLHYHHLTRGGILHESQSFADHIKDLTSLFEQQLEKSQAVTQFVTEFLRPHGRDQPATAVFVEELVKISHSPARKGYNRALCTSLFLKLSVPVLSAICDWVYGNRKRFAAGKKDT